MSGTEPAGVPGLLTTRTWLEPRAALGALQPTADDRILAVCGAGDVAFALARAGAHVQVVDPRHAQIAYARLALAAVQGLPEASTRSLLGLGAPGRRVWFYHYLRPALDEATRTFWDAHESAIRLGLVDQGSVERRLTTLRTRALPLAVRRDVIEAVGRAPDLDSQRRVFHTRWDTWRWHAALRMAFAPVALAGAGIHTPRLAAVHADYPAFFGQRVRRTVDSVHVARHPGLRWAMLGTEEDAPVPEWLEPPAYAELRARLDRLSFVHGRLTDLLREPPAGGWTGFYLGDALDDLHPEVEAELLGLLVRASAPGARMISWRLSRPYVRSAAMAHHLVRDELASARAADAEPIPAWTGIDVESVRTAG